MGKSRYPANIHSPFLPDKSSPRREDRLQGERDNNPGWSDEELSNPRTSLEAFKEEEEMGQGVALKSKVQIPGFRVHFKVRECLGQA